MRELLAAAQATRKAKPARDAGRVDTVFKVVDQVLCQWRTKEQVLRRRRRGGHRQAAAVVGQPISSYRDGNRDGGLPRPGPIIMMMRIRWHSLRG